MNGNTLLNQKKTLLSGRLSRCVASATILGMLDAILFMTDNLVSGRFLGEEALAGLTMMSPVTTFLVFINYTLPVGVTAAIAFAQGRGDSEEANRMYSQGLIVTMILGVFFSVMLVVLNHSFIDQVQVSEGVKGFARRYCTGLYLMPVTMFITNFYYYIHVGEGLENICVASSIVKVAVNITLDIVLCSMWGTFGIGVATTLGYLSSIAVKMIPVIRGKMSLHFRLCFEAKALAKAALDGLMLSADMVCPVLFSTIMNASILTAFGENELVVFSIILNIENFFVTLFFCLANSVQTIVCQYHAERNFFGIRRVMNYMRRCMLLIPGIFMALIVIFAGLIPGMFGITNTEIAEHAATALRLYTPFVIFLGFDTLLSRYYICIGYKMFGFLLILVSSTLLPALLQLVLGRSFGLNGIWLGLGLGYAVALLALPLLLTGIRKKNAYSLSPVLLVDTEAEKRQLTYDIESTEKEVMDCVHDMDSRLGEVNGLSGKRRNRLVMITEENCMLIVAAHSKDPARIELCVMSPADPSDEYNLIIRSDGAMRDTTDYDSLVSSFREYVLSTLIPLTRDQSFISKNAETTLSFRC